MTKIAVVGDFNLQFRAAHRATNDALVLSIEAFALEVTLTG